MRKITIKAITEKSDLNTFIKFPDTLYKRNKYRVTPLHSFEKMILSPEKNPAFDHCDAKYWLAYRDNKVVGRIAGIINRKHLEIIDEKIGRFGWIDFIDDIDVAKALLETAENWVKSKGLTAIHGPLGFSDMDMEGMLVEGFDEVGTQAVLYNYPYYPQHLESLGYTKDVDWLQKKVVVPTVVPEKLQKIVDIICKRYKVRALKINKAKEIRPYAKGMFHTLNESFKDLYGFVPLTDKQIDFYIEQYFSIIKADFVCFVVNENDEVVGFGISMPSLSEALIKAKGKMLPTGFIHLFKALYGKNQIVDMYLNGVRPDYQNKGVHAIYYLELMKSYIANGITTAITNPQLETNTKALRLWESYEHVTHLRRRCFVKHL